MFVNTSAASMREANFGADFAEGISRVAKLDDVLHNALREIA
jgi:hypothetical protein